MSRKLMRNWYGPFRVLEVKPPDLVVRLVNDPSSQLRRVHVDRVKICHGPELVTLADPAEPHVGPEEVLPAHIIDEQLSPPCEI